MGSASGQSAVLVQSPSLQVAEIEATIERAKAILDSTGARVYESQLLEVRAELAGAVGNAKRLGV